MTITLYGPTLSSAVSRVLVTLMEKGVTDYEQVDVDMMNGAQKSPEHLAIQPFGKVPALTDGSLTLFESRAIVRYIAHKYEGQGTPLYGSTPEDAALVEQWLEVESQNINAVCSDIAYERQSKTLFMGLKPDETAVAKHKEKLSKLLDVYEAHLTKNKYLAGEFFSLADLSHLPTFRGFYDESLDQRDVGDLVDSRPHVKAWWEDISSRPAWKKIAGIIREDIAKLLAAMKAKQ